MTKQNNLAMSQIGQKIAETRVAQRLTQQNLAELCRLQPSQIKAVENGDRNYTINTLLIITKTLGITQLPTLNYYRNDDDK